MKFLDTLLGWTSFVLVALVLVLSPWLFGAWEMWWFWPFAVLIFVAGAILGVRFFLWGVTSRHRRMSSGRTIDVPGPDVAEPREPRFPALAVWLFLSAIPFLLYGFIRFLQADVYMDAERSVLRHVTAWMVGLLIVFGLRREQRRALFIVIMVNLCLVGLYGIINHIVDGSHHVLWRTAYLQYQSEPGGRATGPYFCPDHFAGVMELAFCAGVGLLLAREKGWAWKLWGMVVVAIAVAAVLLSRSRGGGMTLVVISAAVLIWGFAQSSVARRWYFRLCATSALVIAVIVFWSSGHQYVERFKAYPVWGGKERINSWEELQKRVADGARRSDRGLMIGGALRAWKTSPWIGIGPGMHQNLWFHFAASPDGDRDMGVRPSLPNNEFHSYEVHSDWVQLLEEYGVVGLGLFLLPMLLVSWLILSGLRLETRERAAVDWDEVAGEHHDVLLAGWLAMVCMAFHSLGDFNLQIPGTTWLLGAMMALAATHAMRLRRRAVAASDD